MSMLRVQGLRFLQRGPYDFILEASQCVSLSGASGAGKTLLLRALVDLDAHEGEVFLDDVECNQLPATDWRKRIALLPATTQWWFDCVGPHFQQVDEDMLSKVGFDTDVMDWEISRLSQGERQRLGLVRMLANQPRVLLLDEPTASLDAENVKRVESIVKDYTQQNDAPVLWVSHDSEQSQRVAVRHLVLDKQGRLSED